MDFFDRRRRQRGRLRDRELPVLDFPITPANSTAPSRWGRYRQILDDLFLNIDDDDSGANKQRKRCCREPESVESIIRAGRILDAAGLEDGHHLNLLDWSPSHNLAIVLGDVVHSLNPGTSSHNVVFDYMGSSISSISWAPDGRHLAVGMYDSLIYIWDVERKCPTRTLRNVHWRSSRVGSLAWKCDNILTSGGSDGKVVSSDPRMPSAAHVVQSYRGHGLGDICGLKWSPDHAGFRQLASGGSDGLVIYGMLAIRISGPFVSRLLLETLRSGPLTGALSRAACWPQGVVLEGMARATDRSDSGTLKPVLV